jgi:hypothetical protein
MSTIFERFVIKNLFKRDNSDKSFPKSNMNRGSNKKSRRIEKITAARLLKNIAQNLDL